jgi:hypothetical protein
MLRFEGDSFTLNMSYDAKMFSPEMDFIDITDRQLHRYWPEDLTRIRMVMRQQATAGSYSFTFTKTK